MRPASCASASRSCRAAPRSTRSSSSPNMKWTESPAGRSTPAAASPGAAPTAGSRSPPPRCAMRTSAHETLLVGADVRFRPTPSTEIRAEIAVSDESREGGAPAAGTATAWQVEAEHHGPSYDLLAYASEREVGLRPRPDQRGGKRHAQVRLRRPRAADRGAVADRQRLARGISRQPGPPHRRARPDRISRCASSARAPA